MIAALICVFSLAALMHFFVYYCRAILASAQHIKLSQQVREVAGMTDRAVVADDFDRLLQFLFLCPEHEADQGQIRAVGAYYRMLQVIGSISHALIPSLANWTVNERQNCSYFAAVVLDHRIARSRDLFARQASSHP